ncbi:unnamed protein product [Pleuronectes platessa]|uniref:Uncharacterized protein n=1 Tax=Pleuronectes platessa TaxID=8262 RepID=A0A9N7VPM7_PLEPL|nr:unnamed protein product [Pleuronectes platessa]
MNKRNGPRPGPITTGGNKQRSRGTTCLKPTAGTELYVTIALGSQTSKSLRPPGNETRKNTGPRAPPKPTKAKGAESSRRQQLQRVTEHRTAVRAQKNQRYEEMVGKPSGINDPEKPENDKNGSDSRQRPLTDRALRVPVGQDRNGHMEYDKEHGEQQRRGTRGANEILL